MSTKMDVFEAYHVSEAKWDWQVRVVDNGCPLLVNLCEWQAKAIVAILNQDEGVY